MARDCVNALDLAVLARQYPDEALSFLLGLGLGEQASRCLGLSPVVVSPPSFRLHMWRWGFALGLSGRREMAAGVMVG